MLAKENRLKKKKDFELVFKNGRILKSKNVFLKYLSSEVKERKVGFIVSKKVSKKAVERNKVKRRLREIIRKNKESIKENISIIIIALPSLKNVSFKEMEIEVKNILDLIK